VLYRDDAMRTAVTQAIIVETSRGWRLDKLNQHHQIDVIVAPSMACLAAIRGQGEPVPLNWSAMAGDGDPDPDGARAWRSLRLMPLSANPCEDWWRDPKAIAKMRARSA
jgi:hypothetical protein